MAHGRAAADALVDRVGRYGVVRQLATGQLTELYIARQDALGGFEKRVVIKALQPRYARRASVARTFLDEARLAARLNHPSIVQVYDAGRSKGRAFIAMEYIQGGTLTDIIKRSVEVGRFLPIEHALHIVGQVAGALDYAHRHRDPRGNALRIVHGNVSLSNIMVSHEGQAKLIAFGGAVVQAQIPRESPIRPAQARYLSPEQVAGDAIDHRSDIYSLGVVLYETTVAQPLWRGTTEQISRWIASEPIRPPTAVRRQYPRALEPIVMKALEKRPADRYQSVDELRRDLEDFVNAAGIRNGAHPVALYLRDLFPPPAAIVSSGGIAPQQPTDAAAASRPLSRRRRPLASRRAMVVAIPALAALMAFAFLGRPSGRGGAPAAAREAPSVPHEGQPAGQLVAPVQAVFDSPSLPPEPLAPAAIEPSPSAPGRRATGGNDGTRTRRSRRRDAQAAAVSRPAILPAAGSSLTLPAPRIADPTMPAAPAAGVVDAKRGAAVVRAHANQVRECFDRALMEQPELRGRVTVRAAIGADGRVLDASPLGPGMAGGGRLQDCVTRAFRGWTFPPPSGGAKGSFTYSFRFD